MITGRLLTVQQLAREYPWPTESGLRWLIFNAKPGMKHRSFAKCVIRIGKRVLIDEDAFLKWITDHRMIEDLSNEDFTDRGAQ